MPRAAPARLVGCEVLTAASLKVTCFVCAATRATSGPFLTSFRAASALLLLGLDADCDRQIATMPDGWKPLV